MFVTKQEAEAHKQAQRLSQEEDRINGGPATTSIWQYVGKGRSYGYRGDVYTVTIDSTEEEHLLPVAAVKLWEYRDGVPNDVRPKAAEQAR